MLARLLSSVPRLPAQLARPDEISSVDGECRDERLREENPSRPALSAEVRAATPPLLRPLVAVHPETEQEALYVPGCHIARVLDLKSGAEVPYEQVIPPLVEHVTRPEHSYAHAWRRGDRHRKADGVRTGRPERLDGLEAGGLALRGRGTRGAALGFLVLICEEALCHVDR